MMISLNVKKSGNKHNKGFSRHNKMKSQSLEVKEKFVILGTTQGAADSVLVRISNGWSKSKDVSFLLASRI